MTFHPVFATLVSLIYLILPFTGIVYARETATEFVFLPQPQELPPLVLKNSKGAPLALRDLFSGDTSLSRTLLHLWAPNCQPCVAEMKAIEAALPALSAHGIRLITIVPDFNGLVTVPAFFRRQGIGSVVWYIDTSVRAPSAFNASGIPVTYALSGSEIKAIHEGTLDWQAYLNKPHEVVVSVFD